MPHVIVIDNFDSFTYNLVEELNQLGAKTTVFRNQISVEALKQTIDKIIGPKCLLISPGPDSPNEAGLCLDYVKELKHDLPIFGICLGHQVIGQAFGGHVHQVTAYHGESSKVKHQGHTLFNDIPATFKAGRYHSLAVTCPDNFKMIAMTDNINMAMCHQDYPIYGLQFHPESILTENGSQIFQNILNLTVHEEARYAA